MNSVVSVVVPCYNMEQTIANTLASIDLQTTAGIQVIVVDDASTDSSASIITKWAGKTMHDAVVLSNDMNIGLNRTLNRGLEHATGDYLVFLDADDRILPHMVEHHVQLHREHPEAAFVFGDAKIVDTEGAVKHNSFIGRFRGDERPSGRIFQNLLQRMNFIPVSAVSVSHEAMRKVGNFDTNLFNQDYDMWLRLSRHSSAVFSKSVDAIYLDRPASHGKRHGGNFYRNLLMIWDKWRDDPFVDRRHLGGMAAQCVMGLAEAEEPSRVATSPLSLWRCYQEASALYGDPTLKWRVAAIASRTYAGKVRRLVLYPGEAP